MSLWEVCGKPYAEVEGWLYLGRLSAGGTNDNGTEYYTWHPVQQFTGVSCGFLGRMVLF